MTREQIDAIRARVDAATPGPWQVMATAGFIASAREDVSALLAEVERLTAERDALVQTRERWLADCAKELREAADDMIAIRKEHERAAFQRGVAAMREAAIQAVTCPAESCPCNGNVAVSKIRALPDPEDKS